ncbi:hypothetical protein CCR75_000715 [Bremia lactucae]|uniref:AMMECR1 domain-containing protein n=1 Tax=Bremia lactucae TaxID=4779 RepID=A0A976ICI3_BRELC|nr:hypothetical protein CCR75_000715 [Bremia lactucae]
MANAAMVVYCFDTLQSHFNGSAEPTPYFDVHQEYPLFVTWEIEEQGGIRLRGCIGTLAPTRLRNLRDFVFKSALRDRRFDPISPKELVRLHCSVSLLIDYQDTESCDDWEIGTHGSSSILAIPVATNTALPREQGWTRIQTVTALIRKAGYRHTVSKDMLKTVKVTRYRSSIHKLTYQQYQSVKHKVRLDK